jgi:outer membrane murein-binding lipoprotein Lpp
MGRPPIGERAMTEAERKRRLRALAKARIAEQVKPASSDHAALVKELAQAKARIAELTKAGVDEITALKEELAQAKEHITEMGLQYAAQRQAFRDEWKRRMATAKPRAEKPPLPPDEVRDRRIKALTTEVQNLKAQVRHMKQHAEDVQGKTGSMSFPTMSAIAKVLHPEQRKHLTRRELDEKLDVACKAFNAWFDSLKPPRR